DGIRDFHVTGVQTCALPISTLRNQVPPSAFTRSISRKNKCYIIPTSRMAETQGKIWQRSFPTHRTLIKAVLGFLLPVRPTSEARSEERRVGKEIRLQRVSVQ